jgi:hypothetical protein
MNYHLWSNVRARGPIVSVLNWFSDLVPCRQDIAGLTYLNHSGDVPSSGHLLNLAMPPRKVLRDEQFDHFGVTKPVSRSEATSSIHGIGGEDGRTFDQALNHRLWPYWQDPTRPVHLAKPPSGASRAEAHAFYEAQQKRMFGSV